jgi:hypothetical protein
MVNPLLQRAVGAVLSYQLLSTTASIIEGTRYRSTQVNTGILLFMIRPLSCPGWIQSSRQNVGKWAVFLCKRQRDTASEDFSNDR